MNSHIVTPPSARHTINHNGHTLTVTIPSQRNIFIIIILSIWLLFWSIGELVVGGMLIAGVISFIIDPDPIAAVMLLPGLFMIIWFIFWTIGGGFATYTLLWSIAGQEIITINDQTLTLRRALFRFGKPKEYTTDHIRDLRASAETLSPNNVMNPARGLAFWGITGGNIAFDYGAQTYRFGAGIDEAEAKQIVTTILDRYPQYGKQLTTKDYETLSPS
ncbi:MAG TPA: hypothetical protein VLL52_02740 [Anaerolineae bacterium]|nr:hypothetical protein [Anaerolineae bacterium]